MAATVKTTGIYKIINATTKKIYIGSSIDIENRWRQHKFQLSKNKHHNSHLQNSWKMHGSEVFVIEIIEICDPIKEILLEREQYYIDTLKPEYNICPKAGSRLGSKASEETKKKMSLTMKGRPGISPSAETRARIALAASNISDETRAKMAASKAGRKIPEETKAKMATAHKGKVKTPEHIAANHASANIRRNSERLSREVAPATSPYQKDRPSRQLFSVDVIRDIRNGIDSDSSRARALGCSQTTISRIRRKVIYKDVI